MSIEARFRTLSGDQIGEEALHITPDGADHLLELLTTKAPFGISLVHLATGSGKTGAFISQLVIGLRGDRGAMYYTDETGSWYTHGPTPEDDGPVYAEVDFPDHSEIPVPDLREALDQYCRTAARPTAVAWQEDPYPPV